MTIAKAVMLSRTRRWSIPEGSVNVIVAEREGQPWYIEIRVGRAGGSALNAVCMGLAAVAASNLRASDDWKKTLKRQVQYLKGISSGSEDPAQYGALSAADALGRTLEEFFL